EEDQGRRAGLQLRLQRPEAQEAPQEDRHPLRQARQRLRVLTMAFHTTGFCFGKKPPGEDLAPAGKAPRPLSVKDVARRTAMLREAAELLDHLPGPGDALHCLLTGRFDLTALLVVLIEQQPMPCAHLRIAALSLKQRNLYELFRLIDAGKIG